MPTFPIHIHKYISLCRLPRPPIQFDPYADYVYRVTHTQMWHQNSLIWGRITHWSLCRLSQWYSNGGQSLHWMDDTRFYIRVADTDWSLPGTVSVKQSRRLWTWFTLKFKKKWTPVIFSNNFNKNWSIFITFGKQNLQRVFHLRACNWWVLMILGTSLGLLYFHDSPLQQATINEEISLYKENQNIIFKISMILKVSELPDWWKNLQQKDRRRPLWMTFETFERTTAAASWCRLVWPLTPFYNWDHI